MKNRALFSSKGKSNKLKCLLLLFLLGTFRVNITVSDGLSGPQIKQKCGSVWLGGDWGGWDFVLFHYFPKRFSVCPR